MKIIEILKGITGAEKRHATLSSEECHVTKEALSQFGSEIASLRAATEAAFKERLAITSELKAACSSFKLNMGDDATEIEMITALQNSVACTLSKLCVPLSAIPSARPRSASTDNKTRTLAEWRKMNAAEAADFFKNGGKLVD